VRRFYKEVAVEPAGAGFGLRLDGRAVKTPARAPLEVPTLALAESVAAEWRAQSETIDPRSMPLTGLANAAIDRVSPDTAAFAAGLARYGESYLICYRAESPERLAARQREEWDPFVDWARQRYDIELKVTEGVIHRPQSETTVARLAAAVAARGRFELAGLSPLVTVGGSLVIALALAEGAFPLETAWAAASLDDQWQIEQWGEDEEAVAALANRRRDFEAGARFLEHLRGT
jgi:chaperone required for assembly of F1-ATPase